MRILMIGAGLGGLVAALALRRAGHDVDIHEAAERLGRSWCGADVEPRLPTRISRARHPGPGRGACLPQFRVPLPSLSQRRLDILVNNAGTTWGAPAEQYPLDSWNKVLTLNLTAPWRLIQAAANVFFLPQHKGVVVNVASTEGFQGHSHQRLGTVAYNASKGAVINLTRALAAEWGPKQIRVNAVAPGFFPTKMTAATLEGSGDEMIAATPLGRLGGEHDLKGAILLLASDAGAHITGQTLVDGGATVI